MLRTHLLSALMLIPTIALAQDAGSKSKSFQIVDWCEPSTVLAGRVSLPKVDIVGAIDEALKTTSETTPEVVNAMTAAKLISLPLVRSLVESGVQNLYVTWSSLDVLSPDGTSSIVPAPIFWLVTDEPAKTAAIVEPLVSQFGSKTTYETSPIDGAVVLGPSKSIARVKETRDSSRTDLARELDSSDEWQIVIRASLPVKTRNEVAAIWPSSLIEPLDFVSPKRLMEGINSLTFKSRIDQLFSFKLSADCVDAQSAQMAYDTIEKAKSFLPTEVPKFISEIEQQTVRVTITHEQLAKFLGDALHASKVTHSTATEMGKMKQVILGIHTFENRHKFLPPRETRLPDGKPLLSWRVHLLPFLGEQELYQQFHLDEPWDSEHNKLLILKIPSVYATDTRLAGQGLTQFAAPVIGGSLWNGEDQPRTFEDITDGTSATVAVWIAPPESAVVWTQPTEPLLKDTNLSEHFFGSQDKTVIGVLDGSVRTVTKAADPTVLKAAITISGGELIDFSDFGK